MCRLVSFILKPETPGGFGPQTALDPTIHPPKVSQLSLVIEPGAAGDDLAECWPCYVVTERLAAAIDAAGLTGITWADVEVTVDEQFRAVSPQEAAQVPREWRWLRASDDPAADFRITADADLVVSAAALAVVQRFQVSACEVRTGI